MSVDQPTNEYINQKKRWKKCRDAVEGSDVIKSNGTTYLPMIGDPNDPLSISKYEGYKERALWHGYTARVLQGLMGALFRKEPVIKYPENKVEVLDAVSLNNLSFRDFCVAACNEVLTVHRYGCLVDAPPSSIGMPYIAGYRTESIINTRFTRENGKSKLCLVVLEEVVKQVDPSDVFSVKEATQYRVLKLDEETGKYQVDVYVKRDDKEEWIIDPDKSYTPTIRGIKLDYIPFILLSDQMDITEYGKPPILDVVEANLSHYRSSADLENGRHWSGNPTMWGAGIDEEEAGDIVVGGSVAQIFSNENSKLELLELEQGLEPLEKALEEKQQLIIVLGARLLEEQKKAVEASDTHKQRQQGENSVLSNISYNMSAHLTRLLKMYSEWSGVLSGGISVQLNTDFIADELVANTMKELREMLRVGDISFSTYFYNLKRMEMYPHDWTMEDELDSIEEDGGGIGRLKEDSTERADESTITNDDDEEE